MGRLAELWQELRVTTDPEKRGELQKEINKIEQYCIDNGFDGFTTLTDWGTSSKTNFDKRFENPNYPEKTLVVFIEDYIGN